jgi:hypothetical protein
MTTATLTEKQRRGLEALEAARRAGKTLSEYAKAHGLVVRELYDAVAGLRKRGVVPTTDRPRKRKSRFMAVQVLSAIARSPSVTRAPPQSGMVCRLVHVGGLVIECGEWPPPAWLSAVLAERRDAAS